MLGISYGTIIGAVVAAMFPDRMDKLILDSVVNPHEYFHDWQVSFQLPLLSLFMRLGWSIVKRETKTLPADHGFHL